MQNEEEEYKKEKTQPEGEHEIKEEVHLQKKNNITQGYIDMIKLFILVYSYKTIVL